MCNLLNLTDSFFYMRDTRRLSFLSLFPFVTISIAPRVISLHTLSQSYHFPASLSISSYSALLLLGSCIHFIFILYLNDIPYHPTYFLMGKTLALWTITTPLLPFFTTPRDASDAPTCALDWFPRPQVLMYYIRRVVLLACCRAPYVSFLAPIQLLATRCLLKLTSHKP